MPRQQTRIKYAIVCDDVRREDNGKFLLIGVYGSVILVPHFPIDLILSIILCVETDAPAKFNLETRVKLGQKVVRRAQGVAEITLPGSSILTLRGATLTGLIGPDTLSVQVKIDQNRWETVCSLALDQTTS